MSPVTAPAQPDDAPLPAIRPPLKWAGGKRWLLPELRRYWAAAPGARLVEPFAGGLAIALGLRPERALVSDINVHAVNFYRHVQAGLTLSIPLENSADRYYGHRERFNHLIAEGRAECREAAELFYYLNRTGYNGLCRFNRRGLFNVPFGRYATIRYQADFLDYAPVLARWDLVAGDFGSLCVRPGDFIYADPPYDVPFTSYSEVAFGWDEQVRLASWLAGHPGPVVVSNQATDRVLDLYRSLGFHIELRDAPRMIACNGDRSRAMEILASRNVVPMDLI